MSETLGTPDIADAHFGDRHELSCECAAQPREGPFVIRAFGDI
jgi:hypothetical protein